MWTSRWTLTLANPRCAIGKALYLVLSLFLCNAGWQNQLGPGEMGGFKREKDNENLLHVEHVSRKPIS